MNDKVPGSPEQVRVPEGRHEHRGRVGHPPLLHLNHRPRAQGGRSSSLIRPEMALYLKFGSLFVLKLRFLDGRPLFQR